MRGDSFKVIEEETGLTKSQVYRYLGRCLEFDPAGAIFGFFGIIPRRVQKPYTRHSPLRNDLGDAISGLAGAFMYLLTTHSELHTYVTSRAAQMRLKDAKQIATAIHRGFLDRCAKFRKEYEYPFNTKAKGRRALERFIRRFLEEYWLSHGQEGEWEARTGQPRSVGLLRPYEEVENDGHLGDLFFVFREKNQFGAWIYTTPMKCFLVLNVCRRSRGILGYSYNLNSKNYPGITVCRSVACTLKPWKPKELTIPGLSYLPGAGLPYGAIKGMPPCMIDTFFLDNGQSNCSKSVTTSLASREGAVINFGRAGKAIARAFIERVNKTLETCGFRKLPVGFDPKDSPKSRLKAMKECEKYAVTIEEFEQILDVIIANYNASQHASLSGQSPNEFLAQWLQTPGTLIREAWEPEALAKAMTRIELIATIRGGKTEGRPPYVQALYARYSNEGMRKLKAWVGLKVRLIFDIDGDIRLCRCFLRKDGGEIDMGVLHAHPPWHLTPHTLRQRQQVRSVMVTEKILIPAGADALQTVWGRWGRQAATDRQAANKLVSTAGHPSAVEPRAKPSANTANAKDWINIRLRR
ncbi:hypothetical protein [Dyella sp. AD56]|uniref:hypothetical protein n=1 Tax=Dyella sp. AD56 TaxID=1528744 RepID=UPI0011AF3AB8|nr:hypothetical protein [Dyella sp. AD56]